MWSTKLSKVTVAINAIFPIVVGGVIYYLISPDVIFVKKIDSILGNIINIHVALPDNIITMIIRNYLPDMMWGYALVFALFFIMGNNAANISKIFIMTGVFSAILEMLQILPYIYGTFDIFDICVEVLAEAVAVFIIYTIYLREESLNENKN